MPKVTARRICRLSNQVLAEFYEVPDIYTGLYNGWGCPFHTALKANGGDETTDSLRREGRYCCESCGGKREVVVLSAITGKEVSTELYKL